jgi:peptidoglycan/LPS O-acetylase OafA/YrhL
VHGSAVTAVVLLVPAFAYASTDARYLAWGSTLLAICVAVAIGGAALATGPVRGLGWLSARPLLWLGERSLLLYIWHYPVFKFVQRHSDGWAWPWRTLAGLALTGVLVLLADRFVERYAARWQASPRWRQFDDGLLPAVTPAATRVTAGATTRLRAAVSGRRRS